MGGKYTDSQKKATNKYLAEKVDEIKLRVPKGEKEKIKAHSEKHDNGSVNGFIVRAITETMQRDENEK